MHIAVVAVLDKVRMCVETVVFAVFEYKNAVRAQSVFGKNAVGNLGYFGHLVGRVGKDKVEHFGVHIEKAEHIAAVDAQVVDVEFGGRFFDKGDVAFAHLHAAHMPATARHTFETNAARSRKKVERSGTVQVEIARQHIEQALFGKVGGGACRDIAWRCQMSPPEFSANNTHSDFRISEFQNFKFQISNVIIRNNGNLETKLRQQF